MSRINLGNTPEIRPTGFELQMVAALSDVRFASDGTTNIARKRLSQISHFFGGRSLHRQFENRLKMSFRRLPFMDIASLRYKYLRDYVGFYVSYHWRREALASHYEILAQAVTDRSNPNLFARSVELWSTSFSESNDTLSIVLEPDREAPLEGELQLSFVANGNTLALLSFLFVDARILQYESARGCIVGALQGRPETRVEVRRLSKLNHEISPFALLMIALRSVCGVLSVRQIVGTSALQQVSARRRAAKKEVNYNALWENMGGIIQPNGFYLLLPGDTSSRATSAAHRRRAARKAERKQIIGDEVSARFQSLLE